MRIRNARIRHASENERHRGMRVHRQENGLWVTGSPPDPPAPAEPGEAFKAHASDVLIVADRLTAFRLRGDINILR